MTPQKDGDRWGRGHTYKNAQLDKTGNRVLHCSHYNREVRMSRESSWWLNNMVLVGFTDKRGPAWHYRVEDQGEESNHYPGGIPVEDVQRRLFNFKVEDQAVYILTDSGFQEIPRRKAMVTSDDQTVLGIFKESYRGHDYNEWLVDTVASILDDDLSIGSAMLLRNRGQACVSVEMPENITTPEGVEFRPWIGAWTSYDGSLATTFKAHVQDIVCDNTREIAQSEDGRVFKVRHSKYSGMRLRDARDALGILHTMGADFAEEVATLTSQKVTDAQFRTILDYIVPVPEDDGRGKTMAEDKQQELLTLWAFDERVAPWRNTAYGVFQAFNTWNHHYAIVRNGANGETTRFLRNMENVLNGKMAAKDNEVLAALATL